MRVTFVANACCIVESKSGTKIVSDPWLNDGVFDGSWCHFHELKTTWDDLQNVDAVYVSHVHPDHFDSRFFRFPKDTPIIVLDHGLNFLHKNLVSLGYTNLIKIKDKQTLEFKDFRISLFAPFAGNNFFEENTKIGNLIDSGIVYEADGKKVFNANDNTPNAAACQMLKQKFDSFDLAMMNYNSAGPYPSCFNNFSDDEKILEHHKNLQRNVDYLYENLRILNPKYFLPFAGAYVLGGRLAHKNKYLGTMTWDQCVGMLREKDVIPATEYIVLNEGTSFDLSTGLPNKEYQAINEEDVQRYIELNLSKLKYPYELDEMPDHCKLMRDIDDARVAMMARLEKIGLQPNMTVSLLIGNDEVNILTPPSATESKGNLSCRMDLRLLRRILDRSSHWNNAEIGCHIEFNRNPNYYSPDIHTALQFFHL